MLPVRCLRSLNFAPRGATKSYTSSCISSRSIRSLGIVKTQSSILKFKNRISWFPKVEQVRWNSKVVPSFDKHPLYSKAKRELQNEDAVACLETCEVILRTEPDNPVVNLFAAGCYFETNEFEKCITHLEKVILQRPRDVEAHHLKAQALLRLGFPDKALLYFDNILKIDDRHLATVLARAHLLDTLGKYEAAAIGFRKASFISRTHMSCFRAAECFAKLGKYRDAIEYYDMAHETWKYHPQTYLGKANILVLEGTPHLALDTLDEMLHNLPDHYDGLLAKANVLLLSNQAQKALDAVDYAFSKGSDENRFAMALKGSILLALQRYTESLEFYEKILLQNPKDAEALRKKSDILKLLGENTLAAEFDARARDVEKVAVDVLITEGAQAWKNGKFEEALAIYEKMAKLEPELPTAALGRGIALSHLGRAKEAKSALQYALALQPATPMAHFYLGNIFFSAQEYSQAAKAFKKAHKLQPNNTEAIFKMAESLVFLKEYDEAVEAFDEVLEQTPDYPGAAAAKLAALKAANTL